MPTFQKGKKVWLNAHEGTVVEVCTGQLTGMLEVRLPGGVACVDAADVVPMDTLQDAAPEMLEALKEALHTLENMTVEAFGFGHDREIRRKMAAAIAKAGQMTPRLRIVKRLLNSRALVLTDNATLSLWVECNPWGWSDSVKLGGRTYRRVSDVRASEL